MLKVKKKVKMESDLDKMFEDLKKSFHNEISGLFYHVRISQVKNPFTF